MTKYLLVLVLVVGSTLSSFAVSNGAIVLVASGVVIASYGGRKTATLVYHRALRPAFHVVKAVTVHQVKK